MIVEIEKNNIIITPLRWFLQHVFVSKTVDYLVKGGLLQCVLLPFVLRNMVFCIAKHDVLCLKFSLNRLFGCGIHCTFCSFMA